MREVKFRGHDADLKKWHHGNYYFYTDTIYCIASDKDREENEHHCILFDGFCDWGMPRPHYKAIVDGKSIGQYTGLKDKSGKEIYEGDIIGFDDCTSTESGYREQQCVGVVEWSDETVSFEVSNRLSAESYEVLSECLVIGNIYENPELLK